MGTLMLRRTAMGKGRSILPPEYQEVEWIEGKYGPAINTELYATWDTEVETELIQGESPSSYFCPYGCISPYLLVTYAGGQMYASFGTVYDSTSPRVIWYDKYHTLIQNKTGWYLDGILQKQYDSGEFTANPSLKIAVFGRTDSSNVIGRIGWWRIKYFIIRKEGVKVSHMVPCYRKSDGEIGMYDTVRGAFFVNVATGAFVKGPNV